MVHCKKNKETKKVNIITEDVLWTCVYVKIKTKQKTLKLKKSSNNNPLPQNTTDTQIVSPLSDVLLLEICNDVWV